MVQIKNKESRKRSAETLSESPLKKKKQRLLPDASLLAAEGHNGDNASKKLAKGSKTQSAATKNSTVSPLKKKKLRALPDAPATPVPTAEAQNGTGTKKSTKGSKKRSTEASLASPHQKKQILPDAPSIPAMPAEVQNDGKVSKKLKKGSKKSAETENSSVSPHLKKKKKRVLPDAPSTLAAAAEGLNDGTDTKKSAKGSKKRSAEAPSGSPPQKKKKVLPDARPTAAQGQSDAKATKKSEKESAPKKEVNRALQVFVGKISMDATKEDLEEHFSQFGSVKSIILPTKPEDRSVHRGFAFVEFADELAKEEALAAGQHKVRGQTVGVRATTAVEVNPKQKINTALQVMVNKIPKYVTKEDLEEHFSQFGSIASLTLPTKPEDRSAHRGFAFVQFADELAKELTLGVDKHEVNGRVVHVRATEPSAKERNVSERAAKSLVSAPRTKSNRALEVMVDKVPKQVSEKDLEKHYSQFGSIKSITMPPMVEDPSTHRGFAFIEFADENVKKAVLAAGQQEVNGHRVSVRTPDSAMLVRQIPKEVGKEEIEEYFSRFGSIKSITLPGRGRHPTAHRGFAFIEFAEDYSKDKVLAAGQHQMNGQVLSILSCKSSEPSPNTGKTQELRVFVHSIPSEAGKEDLKDHFSQFGGVKSISLPPKSDNRSAHRGFAFITFADESTKEKAMSAKTHEIHVAGKVALLGIKECEDQREKHKAGNPATECRANTSITSPSGQRSIIKSRDNKLGASHKSVKQESDEENKDGEKNQEDNDDQDQDDDEDEDQDDDEGEDQDDDEGEGQDDDEGEDQDDDEGEDQDDESEDQGNDDEV